MVLNHRWKMSNEEFDLLRKMYQNTGWSYNKVMIETAKQLKSLGDF